LAPSRGASSGIVTARRGRSPRSRPPRDEVRGHVAEERRVGAPQNRNRSSRGRCAPGAHEVADVRPIRNRAILRTSIAIFIGRGRGTRYHGRRGAGKCGRHVARRSSQPLSAPQRDPERGPIDFLAAAPRPSVTPDEGSPEEAVAARAGGVPAQAKRRTGSIQVSFRARPSVPASGPTPAGPASRHARSRPPQAEALTDEPGAGLGSGSCLLARKDALDASAASTRVSSVRGRRRPVPQAPPCRVADRLHARGRGVHRLGRSMAQAPGRPARVPTQPPPLLPQAQGRLETLACAR